MSAKDKREQLYESTRQDLFSRQLSNAERYDNAILNLSTGFLGISLAFIKDVVPLDKAVWIYLLKASWILLALAIIAMLWSFHTSQQGIKIQLDHAQKYYLENNQGILEEGNRMATLTDHLNILAFILFLFGVVLTVEFVWLNVG